jgi:kynurenine formamidase
MSYITVDLSHSIADNMLGYPGDLPTEVNTIATMEGQGYRAIGFTMSSHTGTHMDAPAHIIPDGPTLDSFPVDKFIGKGQVIDCRQMRLITLDKIKHAVPAPAPEFILLYTGWDTLWGTPAYYQDIPAIDADTAIYLGNLSLKGVGIDTPSVDPVGSEDLISHKAILSRNIILIENLTGLGNLMEQQFIFCCFPLRFKNADGSPVRAAAFLQ